MRGFVWDGGGEGVWQWVYTIRHGQIEPEGRGATPWLSLVDRAADGNAGAIEYMGINHSG